MDAQLVAGAVALTAGPLVEGPVMPGGGLPGGGLHRGAPLPGARGDGAAPWLIGREVVLGLIMRSGA